MTRGAVLALATLAVIAGALWYLQAPPRSAGAYRDRAANVVDSVHSQVQVARLWLGAVESGEVTHPAAIIALQEADDDAARALGDFEQLDPPAGTDEVRHRVSTLTGEAGDALAQLRIAANRGEWQRLPRLGRPLPRLARRLDALERETSP